jgi:hypothetical protein
MAKSKVISASSPTFLTDKLPIFNVGINVSKWKWLRCRRRHRKSQSNSKNLSLKRRHQPLQLMSRIEYPSASLLNFYCTIIIFTNCQSFLYDVIMSTQCRSIFCVKNIPKLRKIYLKLEKKTSSWPTPRSRGTTDRTCWSSPK